MPRGLNREKLRKLREERGIKQLSTSLLLQAEVIKKLEEIAKKKPGLSLFLPGIKTDLRDTRKQYKEFIKDLPEKDIIKTKKYLFEFVNEIEKLKNKEDAFDALEMATNIMKARGIVNIFKNKKENRKNLMRVGIRELEANTYLNEIREMLGEGEISLKQYNALLKIIKMSE